MKFGAVPLDQALGAILAHSADLGGGRLRKGKTLTQNDLDRMATEGWSDVIVAQLSNDDLHEDEAAGLLAQACVKGAFGNVRLSAPTTGRVNLYSKEAGIVRFDPAAIHAMNAVNPHITVATLPPYKRVTAGEMIATIKIITYGVPKADVEAAASVAGGISIRMREMRTVSLIETTVGRDPSPKGRAAIQTRLTRLGIKMTERVVVKHDAVSIAAAIRAATGDAIMLLTASATSDPLDVGPQGLLQAGGRMHRFGIPVDPGNLLFLGDLPGPVVHGKGTLRPVIGLPGCARSLALNGADWVIERVLCGVRVTETMINEMGVGGLLKEAPSRPQPRDKDTPID